MFALNEHQKRELWKAFAQSSSAGYTFIKGSFHVKPAGKWLDTKRWEIDDAERAFGKSINSLPTALTSLGAIGRHRDWSDARDLLQKAIDNGHFLTREVACSLLSNAGFVMTGTGEMSVLLNSSFFKGTPDSILNMLDKPGFYTLIHPKNHPRMRQNLSEELVHSSLEKLHGFWHVRNNEIYVNAIVALMEREHKHYEIFRDQLHAFFAQNNLSAQSTFQLPTPEDVEDWSPSIDPIVKKAFSFYAKDPEHAASILKDNLRLIYRPISISRKSKDRTPLQSLLASKTAKATATTATTLNHQEKRDEIRYAVATVSLRNLLHTVQASPSFNDAERAVVEDAWKEIVEPYASSDVDSMLLAVRQFEESISPWLIHKAENDYPRFVSYVKNTVFKGKEVPHWYSTQLTAMEPKHQSVAIRDCSWWPAVSRLRKMCSNELIQLLDGKFDEVVVQNVVNKILPDTPHAFEWMMMSGFQSSFKDSTEKNAVSEDPKEAVDASPLPVKFV